MSRGNALVVLIGKIADDDVARVRVTQTHHRSHMMRPFDLVGVLACLKQKKRRPPLDARSSQNRIH